MTTKTADPSGFDSEELLALARVAVEQNDLEGALLKLKKIIGEVNPPIEAVSLGARVYAQLGLYERAERLYERYLEQKPDSVLERFQLGMTRFDAGRSGDALQAWERVLKEQPLHPPAMFYKSLALAQSGKTAEARKTLDQLLKAVPVDNLYFGRAKELLQAIEAGAGPAPAKAAATGPAISDPYRIEH